ncbi:hypothetical protein H696_03771 [Fonticula alba]|uniref:Uncharacterized protein n=1 Tax=Fonticula alba TaxID=691883 RepID=A0A058Z4X6_FONAL|nr:hypothetical protein H696_03771 [Fonticula alba]KCV69339.1 hypothetical protein H696_03771 [Fonticula alba]|eukprot:XP_009495904.1 hypothetical protein H696_03771 [Fonticula alba]
MNSLSPSNKPFFRAPVPLAGVSGLPTPRVNHFTEADYGNFYEPAEDSFLLLDALEADAGTIKQLHPAVAAEIGPGSGVVTSFLAALLAAIHQREGPTSGPTAAVCLPDTHCALLCFDINPFAVEATKLTALKNNNHALQDVVLGDLVLPLRPGSADLLVFNPPYVESADLPDQVTSTGAGGVTSGQGVDRGDGAAPPPLWAALDGGRDGGAGVARRALYAAHRALAPGGHFYLLLAQPNRPHELAELALALYPDQPAGPQRGFREAVCIAERKAGWERLSVWRLTR